EQRKGMRVLVDPEGLDRVLQDRAHGGVGIELDGLVETVVANDDLAMSVTILERAVAPLLRPSNVLRFHLQTPPYRAVSDDCPVARTCTSVSISDTIVTTRRPFVKFRFAEEGRRRNA